MNIFCKIFFLVRSGKFFPILFRKKIVKKNWDILARSCITKKVHRAALMLGYKNQETSEGTQLEQKLTMTQPGSKQEREHVQTMTTNVEKQTAYIARSWTKVGK